MSPQSPKDVPVKKHTAFTAVPRYFAVPALLGFLLILGPLVGLLYNIPWMRLHDIIDKEVLDAARLSLTTASISTLICGLLGAPLALVLSKVLSRSRLKKFGGVLYAIIYTPVILSPVVSGLGLLFFWGRKGMIGEHLYHLGIIIPFTPIAVILAQTFVALPFFVATAVTTLQAIPEEYEQIARVEGAKSSEITHRVLLPLAAPGIATAFLLSFARALGEFGATVTFAGNVQGKTETIPLGIELAIAGGSMSSALGNALMLISLYVCIFGLLGLFSAVKKLRAKASYNS